jgi:hypothetical protein
LHLADGIQSGETDYTSAEPQSRRLDKEKGGVDQIPGQAAPPIY